jgi:hypothetical protein
MRVSSFCVDVNKKIPAVLVGRPGLVKRGYSNGEFKAE